MRRIVLLILQCLSEQLYFTLSLHGSIKHNLNKKFRDAGMEGRVVGGLEVPISMYPYIAQMTMRGGHFCMGAIISDQVIITAAHCIKDLNINGKPKLPIDVYIGSDRSLKGAKYSVCRIAQHEMYGSPKAPAYYAYDIALLLLNRRIKFNSVVQKIPIATDWRWRNKKQHFTVAGFGAMTNSGQLSKKLLSTTMRFVDSRVCNDTKPDDSEEMIVPDSMFCMIGEKWNSDCFGDSGSGIAWKGKLVGLVSLGRTTYCGSDMIPSMYTDVVYFRDWVEKNTKNLESNANQLCKRNHLKRNSKRKYIKTCPLS